MNNNLTKFEEDLQNQQFWYEQDPQIRDLAYLQDYQNLIVNTVEIKEVHKDPHKIYSEKLVHALFLPSYLYKENSLNRVINSEVVNLLDCMYVVSFYSHFSPKSVIISLQQFTQERKIIASNRYYFDTIEDISAGILGGKYIYLAMFLASSIDIKIFNLDLSLYFEYSKAVLKLKEEPRNIYYHKYKNLETFDVDYYEPGIVYCLSRQICFRIDLANKSVIERQFDKEDEKYLIRLLPITYSEYDYYFKNSSRESLIGYNNGKEDKLILFVILGNTIYQLNMHNLEIIRITKQCVVLKKIKYTQQKINVIPLQLKQRQKKKFSQWCFMLTNTIQGIQLFDWKEKNLFQFNKENNEEEKLQNISIAQRFIYNNDSIFILEGSQELSLQQLQVQKIKGQKTYSYTLKECKQIDEQSNCYLSRAFSFTQFCPPILHNGEITFPSFVSLNHYENHFKNISNFITFNSFKKQALKQCSLFEKLETLNAQEIFNYNYYKEVVGSYYFLDDENDIYFFLQKQKYTNKSGQYWTLHLIPKEKLSDVKEFFEEYYEKYYVQYENKTSLEAQNLTVLLERNIIMFSQKVKDTKRNQHYLPLLFKGNEDGDTYFGVIDIKTKSLIEKTIHKIMHTNYLQATYDSTKGEFIILLAKDTGNSYFYLYTLDMSNYQFRLINLLDEYLYDYSLNIHNGYLNAYSSSASKLIILNSKRRFEIESRINNIDINHFEIPFSIYLEKIFGEYPNHYFKLIIHVDKHYHNYRIEAIYNTNTRQLQLLDSNLAQIYQQSKESQ